jgi:DNA-binding winged helix-turn-helix (wHTH) protein
VRIAIISKRRDLSRFFELEALNFGFAVRSFDKMGVDLSLFDLCIIDSQTVRQIPTRLSKKVLLVSDADNDRVGNDSDIMRVSYPMSLKELDSIYFRLLNGIDLAVSIEKSDKKEKNALCFYHMLENTARYGERNIQLSDYEMKLLKRLCQNVGEPVSREELNLLLGAERGNIADVYICRLRKKLEDEDGKRVIVTVRSRGYKIITDVEWE